MDEANTTPACEADENYQDQILQGVSRTFALTIPVLPHPLPRVVGNAYLLCRIADTIEDDKDLPFSKKYAFSQRFINVINATERAEAFADELYQQLSSSATNAEKDLIKHTPVVIRITHSFNDKQRTALKRCIRVMVEGMSHYQESNVNNGLKDQDDMDKYCYYVAGVVGEMLTELFCDYCKEMNQNKEELMKLAISFGQGLQMTNILKDIRDDQKRDMCWLPRDVFQSYGSDLVRITKDDWGTEFQLALGQLIGVTRSHLKNALSYTLYIPSRELGMRRFCLWTLGMAVLTLREINANCAYRTGREVKISRRSVKSTIVITNILTTQDRLLKLLFNMIAKALPEQELSKRFQPTSRTV